MRDVGTEMTPIPSQEPSRTGTPIEDLTPSRSSISSITSSPRRSMEVDTAQSTTWNEKDGINDVDRKEFSEKDLKLKIRREIAALGLQLGKLNIASWASKEAESTSSPKTIDEEEQLRKEYEARATAWEEVEKAKRIAR